jgi:1,2-beta-oligoglucan phosphorylase
VPSAAPRQANCYYSSSDAAFADRHEASAHYGRIHRGEVALEGGWRIYSSGAGIAWRLVLQRLLGFTQQVHRLVIDPVLPPSLDGLEATVELYGVPVRVSYRVGPHGHGPTAVHSNGRPLAFVRASNRYRVPGVEVAVEDWRDALSASGNCLEVVLG